MGFQAFFEGFFLDPPFRPEPLNGVTPRPSSTTTTNADGDYDGEEEDGEDGFGFDEVYA
eukprot:CAMPEP_0171785392 /NCGR_PEP_ID=MMETSP0991-20121206/62672_1 /TAXON_ID=483369 /ORGANISM="non described non described, Strain CCMP2098" /LENGTH=58 /DNA_ID=CAMNT_0012393933 /DNA_START=69 /DNA_END=242 /DNA_ORIENTATION=-